jgi:hypothetical protein
MAKKPITMLQIRRIIQLLEQGQSKRKISRILHSSRHTIDGYVLKIEHTGLSLSALSRLPDAELSILMYSGNSDAQPDQRYEGLKARLDYFQKELTRAGVTKYRLWEEYREEVPEYFFFQL